MLSDTIAQQQEHGHAGLDRDDAIKAIRAALKRRTGRSWSVTGGRGTAWGWITITAPPKRRIGFDSMTLADIETLREVLDLDRVHEQGVSIAADSRYRIEYVNRAEGRNPSAYGVPYWD